MKVRINADICRTLMLIYFVFFTISSFCFILLDDNTPVESHEMQQPKRELLTVEESQIIEVKKEEAKEECIVKTIDGLHVSSVECVNNCSNNGVCCDAQCHCFPGFRGSHCQVYDKCHGIYCGHGICNIHTGLCECKEGYIGSDCDVKHCSELSVYDVSNDKCICAEGWSGHDCSICSKYPSGLKNRTYVCCPTGAEDIPYSLLAIPTETLQRYLGGYKSEMPCVLPNKTDSTGNELDCSCRIKSTLGSIDHIRSNVQSMNSKSLIASMYKSNMEFAMNYYKPELIGNLMESQSRLFKSNIQICYCNEWSDSGVQFLVIISLLLVVVFFVFVVYFIRRKNKDNIPRSIMKGSKKKGQV